MLSGKQKIAQNMPFVPTSGSQGAVTVAKSMFRRKNVSDIIYSDVIILSNAKGKLHVIDFLGNDYLSSTSRLPKTSPLLYQAFQSVNSIRNGNSVN
eukprot:g6172.t1